MKSKLRVIALGLFMTALASGAQAQSDTVHSRMAIYALPDSTLIKYELVWLKLSQGGNVHFLRYADTSIYNPTTNYLRSVTFAGTGSDTVSYDRMTFFDDASIARPFEFDPDLQDSSSLFEYWHTVDSIYQIKEISPSAASFDPNSSIDFILQLRNASTDAVVLTLDTLHCFLNGDGHLRYQNFPRSLNIRNDIPLTGTTGTGSYYFKVLRLASLPNGITSYGYSEADHNSGNAGLYVANIHEVGSLPPTYIPQAGATKQISPTALHISRAVLSQSEKSLKLNVTCNLAQEAQVNIVDTRGRVVLDRPFRLVAGDHTYAMRGFDLPSGAYFVQLDTDRGSVACKLSINFGDSNN